MKKILLLSLTAAVAAGVYFTVSKKEEKSSPVSEEKVVASADKKTADTSYSLVSSGASTWGEDKVETVELAKKQELKEKEGENAENLSAEELSNKSIDSFLKATHFEEKLTSMSDMFEQQIEMLVGDQGMSDEERQSLKKVFQEHFEPQKLINEYKTKLREQLTGEELEKLAEINNDPSVKRFNQLSQDMIDPDKQKDFQEDMMNYMKQGEKISPERQEGIKSIASATKASESAKAMMFDMLNIPKDESEWTKEQQAMAKEAGPAIEKSAETALQVQLKDYSNADLKELGKAMGGKNSPLGKASLVQTEVFSKPMKGVQKAAVSLNKQNSSEPRS